MTPAAAQLAEALGKPGKRRKFGNTPTVVDELRFDSKAEARRWSELQLRQRAGEISELARQVRFPLEVNGTVVAGYVADFTWKENGNLVVCDVKSPATRADPTFRLKAKLMSACLGIDILVLS